MVYNTTQHSTPRPPPRSHTLSEYGVCLLWEGGGGQREGRGTTVHTQVYFLCQQATVQMLGQNYQA
jgi:hypothetical protein